MLELQCGQACSVLPENRFIFFPNDVQHYIFIRGIFVVTVLAPPGREDVKFYTSRPFHTVETEFGVVEVGASVRIPETGPDHDNCFTCIATEILFVEILILPDMMKE